MCGLITYIGQKNAYNILLNGLNKLQYRGYDSAGISILIQYNLSRYQINKVFRSAGKVSSLGRKIIKKLYGTNIGIAHTRWGTHGRICEQNAHPHYSDGISLTHNGIAQNYKDLRKKLIKSNISIYSETDSEIIVNSLSKHLSRKYKIINAISDLIKKIKGSYSFNILDDKSNGTIYCTRLVSPLIIGIRLKNVYISSDIEPIKNYIDKAIYIEDGDIVCINNKGIKLYNCKLKKKGGKIKYITKSKGLIKKNKHKFYMHKEIYEEPDIVKNILYSACKGKNKYSILEDVSMRQFKKINEIMYIACGSSYYSTLSSQDDIKKTGGIPASSKIASQLKVSINEINENILFIGVSQSGETADVLSIFNKIKKGNLLCVTNLINSTLSKLCKNSFGSIYCRAGIEIGVASTKVFISQTIIHYLFSIYIGIIRRNIKIRYILLKVKLLSNLSYLLKKTLEMDILLSKIVSRVKKYNSVYCLGRGSLYSIALEAALKIKEVAYIHAEGICTGELKHGPLALIGRYIYLFFLTFRGFQMRKSIINIEESISRNSHFLVICEKGEVFKKIKKKQILFIEKTIPYQTPILLSTLFQLVAYNLALIKGTNIDNPKNLAKCVTVE